MSIRRSFFWVTRDIQGTIRIAMSDQFEMIPRQIRGLATDLVGIG